MLLGVFVYISTVLAAFLDCFSFNCKTNVEQQVGGNGCNRQAANRFQSCLYTSKQCCKTHICHTLHLLRQRKKTWLGHRRNEVAPVLIHRSRRKLYTRGMRHSRESGRLSAMWKVAKNDFSRGSLGSFNANICQCRIYSCCFVDI